MVAMTINPWALDDPESNRQRYTKSDVKRGATELIQCRADAFHVRRVDEIIASRVDPAFKTRSDVVQDALAMWLEDWDRRYPDGAGGELAYQSLMRAIELKRTHREEFLESAKNQLDGLRQDGDVDGLSDYLHIMARAQGDLKDTAPATYMRRLNELIMEARHLLDAGR